jgi:hypothetical protein
MAHFAELDESGTVTQVVVVANAAITRDGVEDESLGVDLLEQITGHRRWTQTSYSNRFRGTYAGIGYQYRADLDAFIPPCPGEGWVLDEATWTWVEQ